RSKRDWSSDVCSSDLVVQTGAVQDPAAHLHGIALQGAQSRKRLAGAEDHRFGSGTRLDVFAGERRDPREVREEVQRHPLAGEDRSEERRVGKGWGWGG